VIIDVLCNWYSRPKLSFAVRWSNVISEAFVVGSGVRKGSCLSPAIFNVFMNVFIMKLKTLNVGCHVSGMFVGCLLYADDIILLSPSVIGLQEMLEKFYEISDTVSLQFNVRKCPVWLLEKCLRVKLSPMLHDGVEIQWCDHIKYWGVYLACSKTINLMSTH